MLKIPHTPTPNTKPPKENPVQPDKQLLIWHLTMWKSVIDHYRRYNWSYQIFLKHSYQELPSKTAYLYALELH